MERDIKGIVFNKAGYSGPVLSKKIITKRDLVQVDSRTINHINSVEFRIDIQEGLRIRNTD